MGVVDENLGIVDENMGVIDRTAVGVVDETMKWGRRWVADDNDFFPDSVKTINH